MPALAAMSSSPYMVVLLDCEMPEMDGYATTAEIRRRDNGHRHTKIIAMTAHALEGARERCLESGMDEYIAKPVTLKALEAVLELTLHQSISNVALPRIRDVFVSRGGTPRRSGCRARKSAIASRPTRRRSPR